VADVVRRLDAPLRQHAACEEAERLEGEVAVSVEELRAAHVLATLAAALDREVEGLEEELIALRAVPRVAPDDLADGVVLVAFHRRASFGSPDFPARAFLVYGSRRPEVEGQGSVWKCSVASPHRPGRAQAAEAKPAEAGFLPVAQGFRRAGLPAARPMRAQQERFPNRT
jgi:hypothetical protein